MRRSPAGSNAVAMLPADGRSREARRSRALRSELLRHLGGAASAAELVLIERSCQLSTRLDAMDRRFAQTGAQSDHDAKVYISFSNSLVRTLRALGLKSTASAGPTLAEALAQGRPAA